MTQMSVREQVVATIAEHMGIEAIDVTSAEDNQSLVREETFRRNQEDHREKQHKYMNVIPQTREPEEKMRIRH